MSSLSINISCSHLCIISQDNWGDGFILFFNLSTGDPGLQYLMLELSWQSCRCMCWFFEATELFPVLTTHSQCLILIPYLRDTQASSSICADRSELTLEPNKQGYNWLADHQTFTECHPGGYKAYKPTNRGHCPHGTYMPLKRQDENTWTGKQWRLQTSRGHSWLSHWWGTGPSWGKAWWVPSLCLMSISLLLAPGLPPVCRVSSNEASIDVCLSPMSGGTGHFFSLSGESSENDSKKIRSNSRSNKVTTCGPNHFQCSTLCRALSFHPVSTPAQPFFELLPSFLKLSEVNRVGVYFLQPWLRGLIKHSRAVCWQRDWRCNTLATLATPSHHWGWVIPPANCTCA